jgi:S1-C subfamily serine protease
MKKRGIISLVVFLSLLTVGSAYFFSKKFSQDPISDFNQFQTIETYNPVIRAANAQFSDVNFIDASKKSTPTVVFIKTESQVQLRSAFWMFDFDPFGNIGKVSSTGSGVIISEDGYIVSNHHVVQNADKIEVVIGGKRNYIAKVVGKAPSSDLVLLKIEAKNLPFIEIANSDELEIGEWVLAVGNPFNLTSTVTAGIVSAKGRNINIVQNDFPIESFIQTDAAINPGNSGGALVNLEGKLVGVNTAIASKTGSYVGYGFAIPSNIVLKIINDLREFGEIQRGFDGLRVGNISEDNPNFEKLNGNAVVVKDIGSVNDYISGVVVQGDIITAIDNRKVKDVSDYNEILARHRPGDELSYHIFRDGKEIIKSLKLVNQNGELGVYEKKVVISSRLNAEFENISRLEKDRYGIDRGIKVSNIGQGPLRNMNIEDGFIFTTVNRQAPQNPSELIQLLENAKGQIRIEGTSPTRGKQVMSYLMY